MSILRAFRMVDVVVKSKVEGIPERLSRDVASTSARLRYGVILQQSSSCQPYILLRAPGCTTYRSCVPLESLRSRSWRMTPRAELTDHAQYYSLSPRPLIIDLTLLSCPYHDTTAMQLRSRSPTTSSHSAILRFPGLVRPPVLRTTVGQVEVAMGTISK